MKAFPVVLALFVVLQELLAQDYYEVEDQLLSSLKHNYNVGTRPNNKTVITSSLILFSLNRIDIGKEEMSITGVIANEWHDPRLTWDPTEMEISSVVARATDEWVPPLVIENNVGKVEMLDDKTPLRIVYDGTVIWTPPVSPTTSCAADITFYPYDKQICDITLVVLTYSADEVELVVKEDSPVNSYYYTENGEWELTDTGYKYFDFEDTDSGFTFRKLMFQISVRRKWPYYGQNIMLPVVLNSLLITFVFALPIEAGERMSYCVTVLLSYLVFLTMVSANLPSISSQISIVQIYLSFVLCLGTLSTMCNIGTLHLYYRDDKKKPVPGWMQTLTKSVLAPLVCRTCRKSRSVSPDSSETKANKEYSSKDIAEMLDCLFFMIFTLVMISITINFIAILMLEYNA